MPPAPTGALERARGEGAVEGYTARRGFLVRSTRGSVVACVKPPNVKREIEKIGFSSGGGRRRS